MRTIATPVPVKERIVLLDVLRGLAIFGILMVNMQLFFSPMLTVAIRTMEQTPLLERLSIIFIKFFFEGKFYVLFSFLFGYGAYLFLQKEIKEGSSILPVYRRRMFILLLIGILHIVVLWPGDILSSYALLGLLLLAFRKASDKRLLQWASWLVILPSLLTALLTLFIALMMNIPEAATPLLENLEGSGKLLQGMVDKAIAVYSSGTFAEMARMRITEYLTILQGIVFFYPVVLAMFLMGMLAARKALIQNFRHYIPFFHRTAILGAAVGIPLSILFVVSFFIMNPQRPDLYQVLNMLSTALGGVFLGLFYVSVIVLMLNRGKLQTFSRLLAPVGRMALTNYLMHSIICTSIFYGYGFGLYGKVSIFQGILLTILIFALQIPFSQFWLNHFHYGPFEWLWRSLTYGKLQPFRKKT
ncbi:MAG: DUF418 domain-containing protein [Bacteroidales bacterium]|jgi:uncharacterized protein|nr:DUF418 domain-containing protein [Bacteroidales bacterium]